MSGMREWEYWARLDFVCRIPGALKWVVAVGRHNITRGGVQGKDGNVTGRQDAEWRDSEESGSCEAGALGNPCM
jgi:hypothetical protein